METQEIHKNERKVWDKRVKEVDAIEGERRLLKKGKEEIYKRKKMSKKRKIKGR